MIELLQSALRLSTPLILAAMGGIVCERSGVATICLEGAILMGAWAAAITAHYTHSEWFALLPCVVGGILVMGTHAMLSVNAKVDAVVSGVVANLAVAGLTPLLCKGLFSTATNSPGLEINDRFHELAVPFVSEIPGIGFLFSQMPLTYFALGLVPFLHWLIFKTRWGLRVTAAGENPEALRAAGVSPSYVRWSALVFGGALAALGGAFISTSHASQFTRDMAAGRGYIALTTLIFGNWKPIPTLLACCLFGLTDALQIRLQGTAIPIQFIQVLPYAMTLVVLVGFVGQSRPPSAIGK